MADTGTHEAARTELEEAKAQLAAQVVALGGDEGDAFDENFADSGQVAAEQGESRVLAGQLRNELDEVERALAKLDAGTYGTCEVCGQPIPSARLEAMPATRFCIDHA
jgi:RNA polymerase-binding transcription factor DksA